MNVNLQKYFSATETEQLARACGFVERKSPITGLKFLLAYTTGLLNTPDGTLAQLATFLSSVCNTDVSPQALDGRNNVAAMAFMRLCLQQAFTMATRPRNFSCGAIIGFDHVFIIDSTNFEIHSSLKDIFKGGGGSGSLSSMRIQFVLDYITGQFYIQIGDTKLCDAPTLQRIVENHELDTSGKCLFLYDLGYFKSETFKKIKSENMDFLSKLMFGVVLHDQAGEKINLETVFKKNPESFDMIVTIDGNSYRLVGKRLSDDVVNKRLRTANRKAGKKCGGRSVVTDKYRRFLHYAIFITTLPTGYSIETLHTLYRVRWQIELVFKTWKSILSIHKIRSRKIERLMCEVYGKLIVAAISSMIVAAVEFKYNSIVISLHRTMRHLRAVALFIASTIMQGGTVLDAFITKQIDQIARLCAKHKQRNKPMIEMLLQADPFTKAKISNSKFT